MLPLFDALRDALIALALGWVGVGLEPARTSASCPSRVLERDAGDGEYCRARAGPVAAAPKTPHCGYAR